VCGAVQASKMAKCVKCNCPANRDGQRDTWLNEVLRVKEGCPLYAHFSAWPPHAFFLEAAGSVAGACVAGEMRHAAGAEGALLAQKAGVWGRCVPPKVPQAVPAPSHAA